MGTMPVAPCKDCTKRYLGCHDRCEAYQQFRVDRQNYKVQKKEVEQIDSYQRLNFFKIKELKQEMKKYRKKI